MEWLSNSFTYEPDLDAYFRRINYQKSREVTLQTLQDIQSHHLLAIPFESLDCIVYGKGVDLSPYALEQKLIFGGRGGYCFEHNILLFHVLMALGFDVYTALARLRWNKPVDITSGATHLVLVVKVGSKRYLCDAGWSSFGSFTPLEIETEDEQVTKFETRRILKEEEHYLHQMYSQDKWHDMYVFTLNRAYPMDWLVGSYFMSTHPTSFALSTAVVITFTEQSRLTIVNKTFSTRYADGSAESRDISTEEEYYEVLRNVFKLSLPDDFRIVLPNTVW